MRAPLPAGWTAGLHEHAGGTLPYVRTGTGGKPVALLVHGFNDSGLGAWTRVAIDLQDEYDVIMVDNRGHGVSSSPASRFTISDIADDLADLIAELGLGPVLLVGHSMGGFVVADLALRRPELLERLVLVDPPFKLATLHGGKRGLSALLVLSRIWARWLPPSGVRRVHGFVYRSWDREQCDAMAQAAWEAAQHPWRPSAKVFGSRRDWLADLGRIEPPTLLLTSEKGLIKAEETAQILAVLPRGTHVHVIGSGHNIQRENYPAFMAALSEFSRQPA